MGQQQGSGRNKKHLEIAGAITGVCAYVFPANWAFSGSIKVIVGAVCVGLIVAHFTEASSIKWKRLGLISSIVIGSGASLFALARDIFSPTRPPEVTASVSPAPIESVPHNTDAGTDVAIRTPDPVWHVLPPDRVGGFAPNERIRAQGQDLLQNMKIRAARVELMEVDRDRMLKAGLQPLSVPMRRDGDVWVADAPAEGWRLGRLKVVADLVSVSPQGVEQVRALDGSCITVDSAGMENRLQRPDAKVNGSCDLLASGELLLSAQHDKAQVSFPTYLIPWHPYSVMIEGYLVGKEYTGEFSFVTPEGYEIEMTVVKGQCSGVSVAPSVLEAVGDSKDLCINLPKGHFRFAICRDSSQLYLVDPATGAVLRRISSPQLSDSDWESSLSITCKSGGLRIAKVIDRGFVKPEELPRVWKSS